MSNPTISSVSYNAGSGVLTVTGDNLGGTIVTTDLILYGASSFTLTKNDIVGNISSSGFSVTLSSADRLKAGAIFTANGSSDSTTTTSGTSTTISNYAYELYAAAGWNGSGSTPVYYTGPLPVSGVDTLSFSGLSSALTLNYNQKATPFAGLILTDSDSTDRLSATLSLTAGNGTLSGQGLSSAVVSGTTLSYTLAATSPTLLAQELNNLVFTPALAEAAGGNTVSATLSLNITGSTSSLDVLNITRTETYASSAPGISSASYDAVHGVLTVSGVNLSKGVALADLSLLAGGKSVTLNAANDQIGNFTSSGFTLTLGSADHSAVNAVLNANGTGSKSAVYTLSAASGWDGVGSPADTATTTASYVTLNLGGITSSATLNDSATVKPFSHVLLTDSDSNAAAMDTATISFTAANGGLSGQGLSAASLSAGVATYTLAATTASNLQQELRSLVFTPTLREAQSGSNINTNLTLTVSNTDSAYGNSTTLDSISNSKTALTVHGSLPAAGINAVTYNAYTGLLTVTGNAITHNLNLSDLTLSNGVSSYTLGAADSLVKVATGSFSVQLGGVGQKAAAALFTTNGDLNGQYQLTAISGWDGANTPVDKNTMTVAHSSVMLSSGGTYSIMDNANLKVFSGQTVSGGGSGDTLTASISYPGKDGSLQGAGLSGSAGNYTLTAGSAAALQQELQQLMFTPTRYLSMAGDTVNAPLTLTVTGTTSSLDSTYVLDTLKITATAGPTISNASYNAQSGVLTVSGSTLSSGVVLGDLTLTNGSQSYTLNAAGDKLGKVSSNGFSVTLGNADKTAVNALFTSNGASNGSNSYSLSTALNWDGAESTATSGNTVTVSGDNSMTAAGLTASSVSDTTLLNPFANLTLTDSNVTESDTVTISFTAGNGMLAGSGLSAGTVTNGVISYTLSATTAATLQSELLGLQFTPTVGISASTQFNLDFSGNIYTPTAKPALTLTSSLQNPVAVVTNSAGDIFVANRGDTSGKLGSGAVNEYATDGKLLHVFTTGVSLPSSLAVDNQGDVYVGNYVTDKFGHSSVQEFGADGTLIRTFTGMTNVESVAVDSNGNVFVACLNGNLNGGKGYVEEFSATGALLRVLTNGISKPVSVAVDSVGDVFVSSYAGSSVREFSASGVLLHALGTDISSPMGVATDSSGDVFIASTNTDSVVEYAASGVLLRTLSNGFSNPASVATDSHGDVFVADSQQNTVSEFSASGILLVTLTSGIANPWAVSTDSQGNVYVANQSGDTVEKFSPVLNSNYPAETYESSVTLTVTANATSFTIAPNKSLDNLTVIENAATGDQLTIANASSFNATALTSSMVTAIAGDASQLSSWVTTALSNNKNAANLAAHGIEWFTFNNNTYLVEQANSKGAAYGGGDTLIELVGVHNEATATFNATTHVLTL
jgi:hypothetical protein